MAKTKRVAVIASGVCKWGNRPEATIRDLIAEAGKACYDSNKRISPKDIQGLVSSSHYPQRTGPQAHLAPVACEVLGVKPVFYQNTDCQCQSAAVNIRLVWAAIMSGLIDIGMAVGVEKIMVPNHEEIYFNGTLGQDHDWEQGFGFGAPTVFALAAVAHMQKYGTTEEQMAKISVKNRKHSVTNEAAHFRKAIDMEYAMNSRKVATPFKLCDCCVNTTGAAALILASEEKAREFTDKPMWVLGVGQGYTNFTMANSLKDLTDWEGVRIAGQLAYKMAGVGPKDIEVSEQHDCFTISEMIQYEELGFCPKGESGRFVDDGLNDYGGKIVTQPRGGLIGCGHPFGATHIAQTHEMYLQMRGMAGERQVKPIPKIGLTQTMSGVGSQSMVIIYGNNETV